MASTTRSAVSAAGRTIEASGTRDRRLLRTFLEQDRVRAGYAICDLDPAEFPRTRGASRASADSRSPSCSSTAA